MKDHLFLSKQRLKEAQKIVRDKGENILTNSLNHECDVSTMKGLADYIDRSKRQLQNYAHEKHPYPIQRLILNQLAKALQVRADWLIGKDDYRNEDESEMKSGPAVAAARPQSRRDSTSSGCQSIPNYITRKLAMTNTDPNAVYCDECWQEITDETFYVLGFGKGHALSDMIICEKCLRNNHLIYLADYLEERKDFHDDL